MAEGTVENIILKAASRRNVLWLQYRLYFSHCSEENRGFDPIDQFPSAQHIILQITVNYSKTQT